MVSLLARPLEASLMTWPDDWSEEKRRKYIESEYPHQWLLLMEKTKEELVALIIETLEMVE